MVSLKTSSEKTAEKVYLGYSQAELDRAYTQTEWADNVADILAGWARRSCESRAAHMRFTTHTYGPDPIEVLDVFGAAGATVHLHIHGGAWQRQTKDDCSFMAPAMQAIRVPFVVPEFGRLPETPMPRVLDQIARSVLWTYQTFIATGPAENLVISGHSSGAHMAALLASYDFAGAVPAACLRAILCVSGPYDLDPVLRSARRNYIDLSVEQAVRLSPIERIADMRVPVHLLYGGNESPEFQRQSEAYAKALKASGMLAGCQMVPNRNHFEIADDLADPGQAAGQYLRDLLTVS
jgi:arylformamidase